MMPEPLSEAEKQAVLAALRAVAVELPGYQNDGVEIEWSIIRLARDTAATGVLGAYPSWRCPLCQRTSYHPDDVLNRYCSCCGSADGLLPKDCEHTRGR